VLTPSAALPFLRHTRLRSATVRAAPVLHGGDVPQRHARTTDQTLTDQMVVSSGAIFCARRGRSWTLPAHHHRRLPMPPLCGHSSIGAAATAQRRVGTFTLSYRAGSLLPPLRVDRNITACCNNAYAFLPTACTCIHFFYSAFCCLSHHSCSPHGPLTFLFTHAPSATSHSGSLPRTTFRHQDSVPGLPFRQPHLPVHSTFYRILRAP